MIVNSVDEVKLVDFAQLRSVKNYKFYACYIKEDVHANTTDLSLFEFRDYTNQNKESGVCIRPKTGISLSGKITLPVQHNGKPIKFLEKFAYQTELTHVFWVHDDAVQPQLVELLSGSSDIDGAFSGCSKLKYFETPSTLRKVGDWAFQACYNLEHIPINAGCEIIGGRSYQAAFNPSFVTEVNIPGSVKTIDNWAFSYLNGAQNKNIDCIVLGGPGDPTQLTKFQGVPDIFVQDTENSIVTIRYYSANKNDAFEQELLTLRPNADGDRVFLIEYQPI